MGCPIRGDLKYGYPEPTHNASICLHARSLSFLHPVKKEKLSLEAPVPSEKYWDLI
jgi:23S rRNA pseudouridine1911/1915/1917 synthase